MYDLKSSFYLDERRDPEKATRAAARYLRDMYVSLDDWYAALAGYNCGEGRVRRSMKKAGSKNYWKYRRFLPKETRNYVPQYIAVTLIGSNPAYYGFENIRYQRAIETETYEVNEPIDLSVLAKCAGIELNLMKDLNQFNEEVLFSAEKYEPHRIANYLESLAASFHRFYTDCRIIGSEQKLAEARIALAIATQRVIKSGLTILGVTAPDRM